ncbi:MAG: phosphoglycerate mutase family protein, partial [Acidimicrobiia bacterium]|nr:phosphoglycerate mutase family protein [Acidimicrobiia bacterium]
DEAPLYLAKYLERQARAGDTSDAGDTGDNGHGDETPLYLRRFRERRADDRVTEELPPLWERAGHGVQQALSEDNRNKEISAPPGAKPEVANEVYLIRHGETQGYSTDSGLTPLGAWQAHTYGHTLAKRVKSGEKIVLVCANTNRAGQTAGQIYKAAQDGLEMFEKDVEVLAPQPMDEFRNFQVATPDGLRDVTGAFRQYYSLLEELERVALGDRPMWLVEIDRFWRTQLGGGDPIHHWLTIPMMHFEPPALCVRRFWIGIQRLAAQHPRARLSIATHSGPIRAFAIWALGYDPGEPYNTEHVRIKLMEGGREALVTYRNRVQAVHVPEIESLPSWALDETWIPT